MRGDFFFFLYSFWFFGVSFFFFLGGRSSVLKIPSGPPSSVMRLYIYMCVCMCVCVCLMKRKG